MHPRIVKTAVGLTAAASGLLLVGGAVSVIGAGIAGLTLVGGLAAGAIGGIATALAAVTPVGLAAIIAIEGGIFAVANWGRITKAFGRVANQASEAAQKLGITVLGMCQQLQMAVAHAGAFIAKIPFLGSTGKNIEATADARATGYGIQASLMQMQLDHAKGAIPIAVGAALKQQKATAMAPVVMGSALQQKAMILHHHGASEAKTMAHATTRHHVHSHVSQDTYHVSFHIDGSKDPHATAKAVDERFKKMVGDIGHAASAVSRAGGVPKSRLAFGSGQ